MHELGPLSSSESARSRKIVASILLIVGGLAAQFAGGKVIDNPSTFTAATLVLCCVGATMMLVGRGHRVTLALTMGAVALTAVTLAAGPGHWSIRGVWLFDIVAVTALSVGAVLVAQGFVERNHFLRMALRTAGATLVLYSLLLDPTQVGRGRETFARATIRSLSGSDAAGQTLAYIVNEYVLVGVVMFAVSYRVRDPFNDSLKNG
jgi:uncharacterized membrane protein